MSLSLQWKSQFHSGCRICNAWKILSFEDCSSFSLRCIGEVAAIQWFLLQHCTQAHCRFVHIPCALNTSVVCFAFFCLLRHLNLHFTFAQSLHLCKFHISSCFMPVSQWCCKTDSGEYFQGWLLFLFIYCS